MKLLDVILILFFIIFIGFAVYFLSRMNDEAVLCVASPAFYLANQLQEEYNQSVFCKCTIGDGNEFAFGSSEDIVERHYYDLYYNLSNASQRFIRINLSFQGIE